MTYCPARTGFCDRVGYARSRSASLWWRFQEQPYILIAVGTVNYQLARKGVLRSRCQVTEANHLDNGSPGLDFVRYIWVGVHRLPQVLTRNDMHSVTTLHNL